MEPLEESVEFDRDRLWWCWYEKDGLKPEPERPLTCRLKLKCDDVPDIASWPFGYPESVLKNVFSLLLPRSENGSTLKVRQPCLFKLVDPQSFSFCPETADRVLLSFIDALNNGEPISSANVEVVVG